MLVKTKSLWGREKLSQHRCGRGRILVHTHTLLLLFWYVYVGMTDIDGRAGQQGAESSSKPRQNSRDVLCLAERSDKTATRDILVLQQYRKQPANTQPKHPRLQEIYAALLSLLGPPFPFTHRPFSRQMPLVLTHKGHTHGLLPCVDSHKNILPPVRRRKHEKTVALQEQKRRVHIQSEGNIHGKADAVRHTRRGYESLSCFSSNCSRWRKQQPVAFIKPPRHLPLTHTISYTHTHSPRVARGAVMALPLNAEGVTNADAAPISTTRRNANSFIILLYGV